ncbi:hypothetical protein BO91_00565 [Candidatus Synechococcus spongiarum LMB bulk10E]|nr:hypothetical protein BO91_00565 [Candidatus Synechococcus spongiarum LMB bulk10E]
MNDQTLLHRIIKPTWWLQDGHISSQAFRPGPSDNKQMSVYDGDQITAAKAWRHYTNDPSRSDPSGVLAITHEECDQQCLPVCPDPDTFPEHVLVDFQKFSVTQIKKKSQVLRNAAEKRGWQYRP